MADYTASQQQSMTAYGPDFDMQQSPLLQAATIFGTLTTQLQDSLPRWEMAAEAGGKAVGDADAVAKYQTEVLEPLMRVLRAVDSSVSGFSRALSQTIMTYSDADELSVEEFTAVATQPTADS